MDDDLGANAAVRRVERRIAVEPEVDDRSHADVTVPGEQEVGSGVVVGAACEVLDVDVADLRGSRCSGDPREPMDEAEAARCSPTLRSRRRDSGA